MKQLFQLLLICLMHITLIKCYCSLRSRQLGQTVSYSCQLIKKELYYNPVSYTHLATKFIPMTGVTLPLVSYGGSSLLCTILMLAIIQGLYILREDEDEEFEKRKQEAIQRLRAGETISRTRQI